MKATTKDWLNFAEVDLKSCGKLLEDDFLTNSVAFPSPQTIEKCFKAVYEESGKSIPRIHNLLTLYNGIPEEYSIDLDEDLLEKTDEVYIESRYPGDIGILANGKPSVSEAKELYEFAGLVYDLVLEKLK